MATTARARIGVQPINWSNDDFRDLGGDVPLERCLGEMREAGYEGTELGHKFPKDPEALRSLLDRFGLSLASGWHSAYLAERELEQEVASFRKHLELLKALGCETAIVAECSGRVYSEPGRPLSWDERGPQAPETWKRVCDGLERLAEAAEGEGLRLAYHPHMGTMIQSGKETERLLGDTRRVGLVLDTGHLAFAGEDPLAFARRHFSRIAHVHLKSVRKPVVEKARREGYSFERAVREGVFTVPGDGDIAYAPILHELQRSGYSGWMIVEAEQDPAKANPFEYARRARRHLREVAGL